MTGAEQLAVLITGLGAGILTSTVGVASLLSFPVLVAVGLEPQRFLQDAPGNTFYLIVIMIWIQAGFAMVILSAAIKAVSAEVIEAARLDGVNAWQMFRNVTLPSIRPAVVADGLAELQVRYPTVPILFAETRPLAEEWTYRFLAAAAVAADEERPAARIAADLAAAPPLVAAPPSPADVRAWALLQGYDVSGRGRVPARLVAAYLDARDG